MENCKVCGTRLVLLWARAKVRGHPEQVERFEQLMERGYCDDPKCEAVALGNSGRDG